MTSAQAPTSSPLRRSRSSSRTHLAAPVRRAAFSADALTPRADGAAFAPRRQRREFPLRQPAGQRVVYVAQIHGLPLKVYDAERRLEQLLGAAAHVARERVERPVKYVRGAFQRRIYGENRLYLIFHFFCLRYPVVLERLF